MTDQREDGRIPVTVIAGFLGAGKTTLVNHLIRQTAPALAPRRIGVIVNEFGAVGVDGGLIERLTDTPDDVQELTNGCLCCTGREDLLVALVQLARRGQSEGGPPAHVLVELSGVADPVPVLHTLLDPEVRQVFRVDSLTTVADARHLVQTVQENPEAALQLAYATTVVLNKTDLVTDEQRGAAECLVTGLQPLARVLHARHGGVDAGAVFPAHDFDADWTPPSPQTLHTPGLKSFTLESDVPLSTRVWHELLGRIVSRPGQVLRVKGHVSLADHPGRLLLHAVRAVISVESAGEAHDGVTRLVWIGRDLDPAQERAAFAALLDSAKGRTLHRIPTRAAPRPAAGSPD